MPEALEAEDMRSPQHFSASSAVFSSRIFRRRGTRDEVRSSKTPCASPYGFLRAKDDWAEEVSGDVCGESCEDQRLRQDQKLLLDLFESAKQAGAVKDTSNEDHSQWMRLESVGPSPPSSRSM